MARDLTFTGLDELRQLVDEHQYTLGYAVLLYVLRSSTSSARPTRWGDR